MESGEKPELFFGLVGPIGVDMKMVQAQLEHSLIAVGYKPVGIRLTELMSQIAVDQEIEDGLDPATNYDSKIRYANAVREKCDNDAALAALAMAEIRNIREQENRKRPDYPGEEKINWAEIPLFGHAFILRQLKRPEEIELLRKVYGRKFIQISVSLDANFRRDILERNISARKPNISPTEASELAKTLVDRDLNERSVEHGQRIEGIFHLGDVFVNAKSEALAITTIRRFIDALFRTELYKPQQR